MRPPIIRREYPYAYDQRTSAPVGLPWAVVGTSVQVNVDPRMTNSYYRGQSLCEYCGAPQNSPRCCHSWDL